MEKSLQKNTCYELKIFVEEHHKDLLGALLEELEVSSFVLSSVDCDIEAEYNPADSRQEQYEKVLAQNTPVTIYSEDKEYLKSVQKALEHVLPSTPIPVSKDTFVISEIDPAWRESWKNSFQPVFVKDVFAILPPWENPNDFPQKFKITIDPGMAFGTGQHETTKLCLQAMLEYSVPHKMLDVGTGSGILAIAAHLLGVAEILATDLDSDCIPIAIENARLNGISEIQFSHMACHEILKDHYFDMVVANIQSTPLKSILADLRRLVADDGVVILSGILVSERDDFVQFLQTKNLEFVESHTMNDWCCIVCKPLT